MIRIIVCVDVDTDDVTEAYRQTSAGMNTSALEWESSDEWYDTDGGVGDPEVLQAARMNVFKESNK